MLRRVAGTASVGLTGLALTLVSARGYAAASAGGAITVALAALGVVLGAALVAAAAYLFRSDVSDAHVLRVGGWNALGVVVLGAVLVLATRAPGARLPSYVLTCVLGVSAVAHVLIGYNDVRRIRARELAEERRKLAMLGRIVRHNLRNETQLLTGFAGQLLDTVDDPDAEQLARSVRESAQDLAGLHEKLATYQDVVDEEPERSEVELLPMVDDVLAEYREEYAGTTFHNDVPAGLTVEAGPRLERAVEELVDNAVTHGSPVDPQVRVSATEKKGLVTVSVSDNGDGIPEEEAAVLTGERDITQMAHTSGLGLWVVKAIVESYGGDLVFERSEEGTVVSLAFEQL